MNRIILLLIFCDSFFAKKEDVFSQFTHQHHWMSQFSLWELMCVNDTLGDSSSTELATIKTLAQNSRYKYLTDIQNHIAKGNFDSAQSLLNGGIDTLVNTQTDSITGVRMADGMAANSVVRSYKRYYQLYLNCMNNTMSNTDSSDLETLAGSCPFKYGAVVFNARALYNIVNNTQRVFSYYCDTTTIDTSSGGSRNGQFTGGSVEVDNDGQSYTLSPNPNDGNFILTQLIGDISPVKIEIVNTIGQTVLAEEGVFSNQKYQVTTRNIPFGLYILKLVDSSNRKFIFKFVVR